MEARDLGLKVNALIDTYWTTLNQVAGTAAFKPDFVRLRGYGPDIKLAVIPIFLPKALVQYRKDGLYVDLCARLEKAVTKDSPELKVMISEIKHTRPVFRIGIFMFCALPTETILPAAPTANDREWLKKAGIQDDFSTGKVG
jgi:hypothetical protein